MPTPRTSNSNNNPSTPSPHHHPRPTSLLALAFHQQQSTLHHHNSSNGQWQQATQLTTHSLPHQPSTTTIASWAQQLSRPSHPLHHPSTSSTHHHPSTRPHAITIFIRPPSSSTSFIISNTTIPTRSNTIINHHQEIIARNPARDTTPEFGNNFLDGIRRGVVAAIYSVQPASINGLFEDQNVQLYSVFIKTQLWSFLFDVCD